MASPYNLPPDFLQRVVKETVRRMQASNVDEVLWYVASLQQTQALQVADLISRASFGSAPGVLQQAIQQIQNSLGPSFSPLSAQLAAAFQNSGLIAATVREMNLRLAQLGEGLAEYQIPVPSELTSAVLAGAIDPVELTELEVQVVRTEASAIRERLVPLIMLLAVMAAVMGTAAGSAPVAAIGTLIASANQIWSWIEKLFGNQGRKAMAKTPENHGTTWTPADIKELRNLAKGNTPTGLIANELGRTEDAVRSKASEIDLSLKPTNQSPYGPRKKG